MWIPAFAGWPLATMARAQAAKPSNDEVMIVGRHRVTPVS